MNKKRIPKILRGYAFIHTVLDKVDKLKLAYTNAKVNYKFNRAERKWKECVDELTPVFGSDFHPTLEEYIHTKFDLDMFNMQSKMPNSHNRFMRDMWARNILSYARDMAIRGGNCDTPKYDPTQLYEGVERLYDAKFNAVFTPSVKSLCGVQPIIPSPDPRVGGIQYIMRYAREQGEGDQKILSLEILSVFAPMEPLLTHTFANESSYDAAALDSEFQHTIKQTLINNIRENCEVLTENFSLDRKSFAGDEFNNIGVWINKAANQIALRSRRGVGNVAWVSPSMLAAMQCATSSYFAPNPDRLPGEEDLCGTLASGIQVYCDYSLEENEIIVGYKGSSEVDAGAQFSVNLPAEYRDKEYLYTGCFNFPHDWENYYNVLRIENMDKFLN